MFIPELQRHVTVCGASEVDQFVKRDPKFWNIVSIREPWSRRQRWAQAKEIHYACFHDVENIEAGDGIRLPTRDDLAAIFRFVDAHPGEPMLVHCLAGQSRSTAVALALIVRGLVMDGFENVTEPAVAYLLQIRRVARPNALVLRHGLNLFLDAEQAQKLAIEMLNHPQLMENRFLSRLRPGI
jgi:predicted protein tyrosine phosphatase